MNGPRQSRIGQEPSQLRQVGIPIATVIAGSLLPILPFVATAPVYPALGLIFLLVWRSLHRDLWPVWMPLPLGLVDDIFSGQPIGSAMLLWTLAFLALDAIDRRSVWRAFRQEWMLASIIIIIATTASVIIANLTGGGTPFWVIVPQMLLSILSYPVVSRLCAHLDRWRF